MEKRIAPDAIALVAEQDGQSVGFILGSENKTPTAGLLLLLVEPTLRRQGIASRLLQALEARFRSLGITELILGFGPQGDYFWPGVPISEKAAWHFFSHHGWKQQESSSDLILDLSSYDTPTWVLDRLKESGATLTLGHPGQGEQILAFERLHFPEWAGFFEGWFSDLGSQKVLIARAANGSIVGTVQLDAKQSILWSKALGQRCGALSVLGVANDQQGRGIGLALAARSAELLKEQGCSTCYIGWTGLVSWYGKLGAELWNEYRMSRKRLA